MTRHVLPPVVITLLVVLPLLATRLSCRCGSQEESFGIGDPVEHPPLDDDGAPGDDDDCVTGDDDIAGDDDSATWPPDPCGTIYEPVNPDSGDVPGVALVTNQGIGESPDPKWVRAGLFDDAATSLAVLWQAGVETTATEIEWGVDDVTENRKVGATFLLGPEGGDQERIHEARICDLPPGTTIQYRVGTEGHWSDTYTYATFDPGDESLSFVALGDSRGPADTLDSLFDMAQAHDPALLLHTGDFVSSGSYTPYYGEFFEATSPELAGMPLLPIHGNHEGMAAEYFGMVAAPDLEEWYSVDVGPVHFAVINNSCDEDRLAQQAEWLDLDLSDADAPFTVVGLHMPIYSSGSHGSDMESQEVLVPVLDAHDVQLVLAGHDHGYERSQPLRGGVIVGAASDGTTYVTTAGGGASLYTFTGDWFTAFVESVNHYCHIQVTDQTLTLTAYRLDGSPLDSFTIDLTE